MIKVSFSSCQSSGKTTLICDVETYLLSNTSIVPQTITEIAREVILEGVKLDQYATLQVYSYMLAKQMYYEWLELRYSSAHVLLCDRSIIDCLIYLPIVESMNNLEKTYVENWVYSTLHLSPYDLLVVPEPLKLEDDGVRCTNQYIQSISYEQATRLAHHLYSLGLVKKIVFVNGSKADRCGKVVQAIQEII